MMALARARIAQVAAARSRGWLILATLVGHPDRAVVGALRDGSTARELREATSWLGSDSPMVEASLASLEVFARGARRRDPSDDLGSLQEDYGLLTGDGGDLVAPMTRLADLCAREARAWADGEDEAGKTLRSRQRDVANLDLAPLLVERARELVEETTTHLSATLGKLLLAYLSAETGRDYQRAVLGGGRPQSRR